MINNPEKRNKYEELYDEICNYLDEEFKKKNYCDFKNDRCIANREGATVHDTMGCCYSFTETFIRFKDVQLCKYQKNRKCEISCLGCKLWTCNYLRKKGIKFNIDDIPNMKNKLSKKEKAIIQYNLFKTKDEIIDKLMKKSDIPYYLWFILEKYKI